MTDTTKTPDNTVSFFNRKSVGAAMDKVAKDTETEDYLRQGLEAMQQSIAEGAKGFVSILFTDNKPPTLLWVGEMNGVEAAGALRLAEFELFKTMAFGDEEY